MHLDRRIIPRQIPPKERLISALLNTYEEETVSSWQQNVLMLLVIGLFSVKARLHFEQNDCKYLNCVHGLSEVVTHRINMLVSLFIALTALLDEPQGFLRDFGRRHKFRGEHRIIRSALGSNRSTVGIHITGAVSHTQPCS